jgi:spermidine synthase
VHTHSIPALVFALSSGTVSLLLFHLYRKQFSASKGYRRKHWASPFNISPSEAGGFSYRALIVVSMLGLFLELLLIQWVSSEVRIFSFFKNFVLIACFLGFGLGGSLCRRSVNLLPLVISLLTVVLLIKSPWQALRSFIAALPNLIGSSSEVHIWGVASMPDADASLGLLLVAVSVVAPFFGLLTLIFVPIGQLVGWHLESVPSGILAYSANVLASLAGIALYTLLCFLSLPPSVWFGVAGVIALLLFWKRRLLCLSASIAFGLCATLTLPNLPGRAKEYWSPYQKLTLQPHEQGEETILYSIFTNESWYQEILSLTPPFVARYPELYAGVPAELNAYNLPYRFFPTPPSVLILGAGTGNDVAAALRNGAGRVVAIEIDPLILKLGKELHFEKPYDSPRVQTVLEDARSYIQNSREQFDLVLFSLLDSHTTSSHYTNIRIDNYMYTIEALKAARRLLLPNGVFVIKFQVETRWIAGRLQGLMNATFERPPIEMRADQLRSTTSFFIHATNWQLERALSDAAFASHVRAQGTLAKEKARLTTDDWPYFYQHEPGVPAIVIAISIVLLLLCLWSLAETGISVHSIQWHFFFLGAGFLLMEVQIISKMALLLGPPGL